MFSLLDGQGQSSLLQKSGTVEINTDYQTTRKPVWLVMLKLLGVAIMIAVGTAIALPTLLELEFPLWHAVAITVGAMFIYTGLAFFFRPESDTDNVGHGVNRILWRLHCVLGPGRFTAETLLDLCLLLGIARTEDTVAAAEGSAPTFGGMRSLGAGAFDATRPIAPLDPNRFAQSSGNFVAGQIQLDSQRYFGSAPATRDAQAAKL